MAPVSSISGAQSAAQSGLQQLRLQQARRDAEQAEQVARSLEVQARAAQLKASEAQQNAQSITLQSDQAQTNAGQARLGLALINTVGQMQTRLSNVVEQVVAKQKAAEPSVAAAPPVAVINTEGQTTGTVINTTA